MNKKFLSLMTAVLILMAAFASCDKDKGGSGGTTGDNPFVGTWISDEDDGGILEVTGTLWAVEYGNTTILKGNYTYKGNSANLTVTYVIDEDAIGLAVGDVGTAKISSDEMTVTFYGEDMVFIKEGGGGDGDAFVVTAKNVIGGSSDIATVMGVVEGDYDEYEIASAPYKNNGFELKLPATVANKYLWNFADDEDLIDMISDKQAKGTSLWIEALDSDKDYIGEFYYEDEGDDYYAAALYLYADRDFTIKGSIYEEWEGDYYEIKWNCSFKKGWNTLYMFEDNGWDEYYTTTKPSNVNLKWYFYGDCDGKNPPTSPKHKNAGFEKFRAVK